MNPQDETSAAGQLVSWAVVSLACGMLAGVWVGIAVAAGLWFVSSEMDRWR